MHSEEELETAIKQLRRGRGLAVNAGSIGITLATAEDPAERAEMAAFLTGFTTRFCNVVDGLAAMPIIRTHAADHPGAFEEIKSFAAAIGALDPTDHFEALTRDSATKLTTRARDATLPSFYAFIRAFEGARAEAEGRRAAHLKDQTEQLERMFVEVEDIGRMIHLISLNASVEAARAGGESGRSFKVIADEIRSLAAKSAELIDTTRLAMRESASAPIGGRLHG
ncbi:MAG: methyl-accepting chemotaxis protein [Pseudomonadota bacterium]